MVEPDPEPPTVSRSTLLITLVLVALCIGAIWYFRPWFQGLVYAFYVTPVALPAFILAIAAAWTTIRVGGGEAAPAAAATVFVGVLVVGAVLAGLYAGEYLGKQTMEDAKTVGNLSESDPQKPRVVTQGVSQRYASNTLNFPQYRITSNDITIHNGTPHWSYALAPDGLWNVLTKKQHGTVMVDMTQQNAQVKTVTGDVEKGVGTAFYNHYKWKLLKSEEYLVSYKDPYMVIHEGEQYIAVPYTKPEFHALPVPYTTPEWGGVMLIDRSGDVTDLSPEEARNHPVLSEQKLYPFDLARKKVAATKYRNGIINTFTSHEGEIEVAPVPGANNDQPFLVLTERGPEYLVAVEPYGDAQGLREVWSIDGRTGEYERYAPEESLFGPRKATDYVRQAARTTDWNRFNPSEPIPVVVDGQLYWEVRVVPGDQSGIAYVAMVNAQSSDVTELETTPEIIAFLEGEAVTEPGGGDGDQTGERQPTLVVQRVAENGTVLGEMEVYGNETVRIDQVNQSNAS